MMIPVSALPSPGAHLNPGIDRILTMSTQPQAAEAAQQLEDDAAAEGWLSVEADEEGGEQRAPARIHEYVQHAYNRLLHSRRLRCKSAGSHVISGASTQTC